MSLNTLKEVVACLHLCFSTLLSGQAVGCGAGDRDPPPAGARRLGLARHAAAGWVSCAFAVWRGKENHRHALMPCSGLSAGR